jgi:beta-galactosidase GanA
MLHTKVVEKIKTHILRSVTFSSENRAVYEIMWKNTAHETGNNMAHAHCMLDN